MEVPNETYQKALNNISRLCQQKIKLNSKYLSARGNYIYIGKKFRNCLIMIST